MVNRYRPMRHVLTSTRIEAIRPGPNAAVQRTLFRVPGSVNRQNAQYYVARLDIRLLLFPLLWLFEKETRF
jgi:hypothetical protein